MSETKNPGDKTLHTGPAKTLSTKRPIEQGTVRQSFSHGRSKSVVVETVKRRPGGAPAPAAPRKLSVVPQAQTHRGWTHHLWRCRLTAASLTTTASK